MTIPDFKTVFVDSSFLMAIRWLVLRVESPFEFLFTGSWKGAVKCVCVFFMLRRMDDRFGLGFLNIPMMR